MALEGAAVLHGDAAMTPLRENPPDTLNESGPTSAWAMGSFKKTAELGPNRRSQQVALAVSALVLRDDRPDFYSPNFRRFGLGRNMNC